MRIPVIAALLFAADFPALCQLDPSILLQGQVPRIQNPLDTALKAQQIINMRLDAQRQQQEIEAARVRELQSRKEAPEAPLKPVTTDVVLTAGLANGRLWMLGDKTSKQAYVLAVRDMSILRDAMRSTDIPNSMTFPPLSVDEVVGEVDFFYSEASNRPIPILESIAYVNLKARGAPPQEMQELAASLRRALFAPPTAK